MGGGAWSNHCKCSARLIVESEASNLLAGQHTASCNKSVHDFKAYTSYQGCSVHKLQQSSCPPTQFSLSALDQMPPQVVSSASLQLILILGDISMHCGSNMMPPASLDCNILVCDTITAECRLFTEHLKRDNINSVNCSIAYCLVYYIAYCSMADSSTAYRTVYRPVTVLYSAGGDSLQAAGGSAVSCHYSFDST